jgi:SPP1 family predicted phage head-tail adaptor
MKKRIGVSLGDLREWLTIQMPVVTKDAYGSDVETFVDRARVRGVVEAEVARPGESLYVGLRQVVAQNPTRIIVRFRKDVSVRDRVLWGARIFNVVAVRDPEDGLRRFTELYCVESQQ